MSNKPKNQTLVRKQQIIAKRVWTDYDESLGLISKITFHKLKV